MNCQAGPQSKGTFTVKILTKAGAVFAAAVTVAGGAITLQAVASGNDPASQTQSTRHFRTHPGNMGIDRTSWAEGTRSLHPRTDRTEDCSKHMSGSLVSSSRRGSSHWDLREDRGRDGSEVGEDRGREAAEVGEDRGDPAVEAGDDDGGRSGDNESADDSSGSDHFSGDTDD
jgi:hypothetical protein